MLFEVFATEPVPNSYIKKNNTIIEANFSVNVFVNKSETNQYERALVLVGSTNIMVNLELHRNFVLSGVCDDSTEVKIFDAKNSTIGDINVNDYTYLANIASQALVTMVNKQLATGIPLPVPASLSSLFNMTRILEFDHYAQIGVNPNFSSLQNMMEEAMMGPIDWKWGFNSLNSAQFISPDAAERLMKRIGELIRETYIRHHETLRRYNPLNGYRAATPTM